MLTDVEIRLTAKRLIDEPDVKMLADVYRLGKEMRAAQQRYWAEKDYDKRKHLLVSTKAAEKAFDDAVSALTAPTQEVLGL